MEYWEITKSRALETMPVWSAHFATLSIGTQGVSALEALIDGFEGLAQTRTDKQDTYRGVSRHAGCAAAHEGAGDEGSPDHRGASG